MSTDEREIPPPELRALARERSQARRERRFEDADRIRAAIETQGWNVVDRGSEARLVRAHPLEVIDADGGTRYGWSGAVPEASDGDPDAVTIALRALPKAEATDSLIARLTGGHPTTRQMLAVVGDGHPDPTLPGVEVIRLRGEVGPGTLLAVALQRVAEGVVVVGERWPADASPADVDRAATVLADPVVAVVGLTGVRSTDLRRFEPGGPADTPTEAVGWAGLAFRARDGRARGPVDERFADPELLAAWWSLVLRDEGEGVAARAAVATRATPSETSQDGTLRDDRATRRDRYRIIDRFHDRGDLLTGRDPSAR